MYAVTIWTPHAGRVTVRPWQASADGSHIEVEAQAMAHRKYWLSIAHLKREGERLIDNSDQSQPVLLRKSVEITENGERVKR